MRRNGPTRHVAQVDPEETDTRTDTEYCGLCHLAAEHPIHDVPEVPPERKAYEARKTGDRQWQ